MAWGDGSWQAGFPLQDVADLASAGVEIMAYMAARQIKSIGALVLLGSSEDNISRSLI